jgi:hypothetical protein
MKWAGHAACIGERLEGERPLGRPIGGWEDTIKMDVKSFGSAWTGLI